MPWLARAVRSPVTPSHGADRLAGIRRRRGDNDARIVCHLLVRLRAFPVLPHISRCRPIRRLRRLVQLGHTHHPMDRRRHGIPDSYWAAGRNRYCVGTGRLAARCGAMDGSWLMRHSSPCAISCRMPFLTPAVCSILYYFIYCWVPCFLLLGFVLARLAERVSGIAPAIALIGVPIVSLVVLKLSGSYWLWHQSHPSWATAAAYLIEAALFVPFAIAIWWRTSARPSIRLIGVLCGVGFISAASATDNRSIGVHWLPPSSTLDFDTTVDAQNFIQSQLVPERHLLIGMHARAMISPRRSQSTVSSCTVRHC